jgi:hypothetical protein
MKEGVMPGDLIWKAGIMQKGCITGLCFGLEQSRMHELFEDRA